MGLAFLISVLFLMAYAAILPQLTDGGSEIRTKSADILPNDALWNMRFCSAFLILFAIRILLAALTKGYTGDMSCWSAWGKRMETIGASGFYTADYFCDYPPGYLYILGLIARLTTVFSVPEAGYPFFYKLPALLCDMGIAMLLFRTAGVSLGKKNAFFLSVLFLITPIFWYDSAVWGQIESVLLLLLLLALLKLQQKKYVSGVLLYVLAVLIKPQGLILAPVLCLVVLDSRSLKTILSCVAAGIVLLFALTMPFSPAWREYTGFTGFLHALNPLWLIEKYRATLASYPYYTVNAYNFYGLLGLNWVPLSQNHAALLSVLQGILIAVAVLGAVFFYLKIPQQKAKVWLSAYLIYGFLFTFGFKMHERYVVLPILFLLIAYLYTKNKKLLSLFGGFSVIGFLNLYDVLRLAQTTQKAPSALLVLPISLFALLLFAASIWVIAGDFLTPKKAKKTTAKKTAATIKERILSSAKFRRLCMPDSENRKKMLRTDYILLAVIMAVYSAVAFYRLGDLRAPQTFYQPLSSGETFTITLREAQTISGIDYYCGIGDVDSNPGIWFSYSADGETWTEFPAASCTLKSVFHWETETIPNVYAKYLRGRAQSDNYRLLELGIRSFDGSLAEIETVTCAENPTCLAMTDEQELVTDQPSYQNGTYFDEIYHPRTAYEHLHRMPYYETTHPPLGKLMMAVGIALFGMTPFGWRCMGTLMGVLMLPIFYLFLKQLFGKTRYAWIGTALFAFDFMHFSLTRMGTIDSYPVFFILCMYYFMYRFGALALSYARGESIPYRKLIAWLALSGLAMGLGCASKWTAVYAAVGLAVVYFLILIAVWRAWDREPAAKPLSFVCKTCGFCIIFFVLIPAAIYTLSYLPIAMVDGYGNVFEAMLNNQTYMLHYHSELGGTHPYSSKWYTWPFVYRPMWAYQAPQNSIRADQIGCISIFQNPLLSWLGIAAFFYSLYVGIKKKDKRVLFLAVALLAEYLPWIFVRRYALQYHFFATLPFMILLIIYAMQDLEARFPKFCYISTALVFLCLLMFPAFYPVLSGIPVSRFYVETFLTWFSSWVFFI